MFIIAAREISIHALREEGDLRCGAAVLVLVDFYPRPPRGGRPRSRTPEKRAARFLSTPSARRATICRMMRSRTLWISIHALREEGDTSCGTTAPKRCDFYPRPPRGGRPRPAKRPPTTSPFLSTPSARRATWPVSRSKTAPTNFYPRPPRGGRPPGGCQGPGP